MSAALDKKFWSEFAKKNWEKKPLLVRNFKAEIAAIDSKEIFSWLVQYSDQCRKNKTTVGLKFYIDGESQYQSEVLQALPVKQDKSLLGYHQRMSQTFPDYCLVCDELIQVSGSQQIALRKITGPIYDQVGIPNRQTEIGLYLGNYKKTPFGVHVDGCGVFSFPIEGIKKFRLWPDRYVKKNPDLEMAFDYKKHIKKSKLMTARIGDMVYWPSKAWHIAESNGEFSATWSLGVWVDQPFIEILGETLQPLLDEKLKSGARAKSIRAKKDVQLNGQITELPPLFSQSVEMIGQLTKNELHDLMMKKWLIVNSKNGFKSSITPNPNLKFKSTDHVRINLNNPLLWSHLKDGNYCLAIHGKLHTLPNSNETLKFIRHLNSGQQCDIRRLLNNKIDRNIYKKILQLLVQTQQLLLVS